MQPTECTEAMGGSWRVGDILVLVKAGTNYYLERMSTQYALECIEKHFI